MDGYYACTQMINRVFCHRKREKKKSIDLFMVACALFVFSIMHQLNLDKFFLGERDICE